MSVSEHRAGRGEVRECYARRLGAVKCSSSRTAMNGFACLTSAVSQPLLAERGSKSCGRVCEPLLYASLGFVMAATDLFKWQSTTAARGLRG